MSKENESGREYGMRGSNKKCEQNFGWDSEYPFNFAEATEFACQSEK